MLIPDGLSRADEEDARGYAREELERERAARRSFDDCGPFVDGFTRRLW